ncbi:dolichol-phosphate mannosyltransferase subunit 3 [Mrakia frigida]|uniref:dolichol-phosphate mannosyltransferase subunit 3 n=1 Tax=Mrakia frigida TaxID=29902 RepID=UPI003FCC078F
MTRATSILLYTVPLTILYFLFLLGVVSVPLISTQAADEILPVIPWVFLVTFGAYSLGSLGWGLVTFRDCPEAYRELMMEITQAKDDLRSKGVSVDT